MNAKLLVEALKWRKKKKGRKLERRRRRRGRVGKDVMQTGESLGDVAAGLCAEDGGGWERRGRW